MDWDVLMIPIGIFFGWVVLMLIGGGGEPIGTKDAKVKYLNVFVEADEAYREIYENDLNLRDWDEPSLIEQLEKNSQPPDPPPNQSEIEFWSHW